MVLNPAHNPNIKSKANISPTRNEQIDQAIQSSQDYFLSIHKKEGYWVFPLEADSTLVADYVMLARYVGKNDPAQEKKSARWLFDTQLKDGGWNIYHNGPSKLNATVKCAFALQLMGYSNDHPALQKAQICILEHGGLGNVNSYTRFYLGLFGHYPWHKLISMPPELMFLPTSFYFNIYEISSWSRTILVPMCIIWANKSIKEAPPTVDTVEWWSSKSSKQNSNLLKETFSWKTFFTTIDAIVKRSHHFYAPFTRREALRRAEAWLLEHAGRGGGLGAIYPAMLNAIIALDCLGYDHDDPVFKNAWDEFIALKVELEDRLWFQPCFSPCWDTAMVATALIRSGMPADHPALQQSVEWLVNQEVRIRGDWQIKNPYGPASGWVFEFDNDFYPDTDDAAMVLMALHGVEVKHDEARQASIKRGIEWLLSMQNSDGGWGAFDVDNNKEVLNLIPFADHNALLDPSTVDVTARILEMLGEFGYDRSFSAATRAVIFVRNLQESDGSWYGRWGVNYIYGTWQAITGLVRIGVSASDPCIKQGVDWFLTHQNEDGGWGETCVTYHDPDQRGQGPSTPSQTAWAIMGLMHGDCKDQNAIELGMNYLLDQQKPDGSWDEDEFTGTGFPKVFYLRYTGYRNYFPLMAYGLYKSRYGS